jgi:hypothetical protein
MNVAQHSVENRSVEATVLNNLESLDEDAAAVVGVG